MDSKSNTVNIEQAARLLGRSLCGRVPHIVGVSLRRSDPNVPKLDLYVDIDSDQAAKSVPPTFLGYDVYVRLVGTPRFAAG